jgi:hypothetical protein
MSEYHYIGCVEKCDRCGIEVPWMWIMIQPNNQFLCYACAFPEESK